MRLPNLGSCDAAGKISVIQTQHKKKTNLGLVAFLSPKSTEER